MAQNECLSLGTQEPHAHTCIGQIGILTHDAPEEASIRARADHRSNLKNVPGSLGKACSTLENNITNGGRDTVSLARNQQFRHEEGIAAGLPVHDIGIEALVLGELTDRPHRQWGEWNPADGSACCQYGQQVTQGVVLIELIVAE
jgi:hypothetical protein